MDESSRAIRGRKDLGPRLVVQNHREPHGKAENFDGPVSLFATGNEKRPTTRRAMN
jgi:hypothetical protein